MYEGSVSVGIIVILVGFALVIVGTMLGAERSSGKTKTEWGFFGLIGPFPIGFGSSKNAFLYTAAIAVIFFIIFILLNTVYK